MGFFHWIKSWSARWNRPPRRLSPSPRLLLEQLEDRVVPSAAGLAAMDAYPLVVPLAGAASAPYTPAQIRQAYGFNRIAFTNGVTGDGSGQTIAIVDAYNDPNIGNDLHQFDQQFGLPDPNLNVTQQLINGQPPPVDPTGGWEMEQALDVEWAHAMAPGANILLIQTNNSSDANLLWGARYAASQPGVSVVSMSFGWPQSASESSLDHTFTTPAGHAGVTFVAASGDNGTLVYPAASPNVIAVGGTSLTLDSSGNYLGETAWNGSGGGLSPYESEPNYQWSAQGTGKRSGPDVAYAAAPNSAYLVYDSFDTPSPWLAVSGTSAGAPQWAALIAIADQGRAVRGLGTLNGASQTLPMLYGMPATDFHDITSGGNSTSAASPGYDSVTGRGTPYADRIVAALAQEPYVPPPPAQPSGPQPSAPQPSEPAAGPPASATSDLFNEVARDALFVVQALESNNFYFTLLGLQDFWSTLHSAPASVQPQLQQAFLHDCFADLL
jgi:subtilase family serine protease